MRNLHEGLEEVLDAIIGLVGADKANVRLLDRQRRVLAIEAQRGFGKDSWISFARSQRTTTAHLVGRYGQASLL
jgi:hypothetical protein